MTRRHDMPFGAQITAQGVRFRLWAPGRDEVGLCLDDASPLPMARSGDGWFERVVAEAGAGTRYGFALDDGLRVPDPASRFNPDDVHGASEVIDPAAFHWQDANWRGRRWEEAVVYELHVGTFSPQGTFAGVLERLDYLVKLGVTAIELMPVADFPGARNWGYDGALPFAPDSRYGHPEELKALIQTAHAKGLMVLLDVVYNHFGPEGNYLHLYAPPFFSERHHTPWGAALNFDGPGCRTVRDFFIHNALYWLQEYHLDGLRLDAVHAILDDSAQPLLTELAERVHAELDPDRLVHLTLENDANEAHRIGPGQYVAQWNDDMHHALHVLCTDEADGYYVDYADDPVRHLGRCLAEGFAYQGELSAYRDHVARGEASAQLPPQAFVSFLQCHDQIGNRAFGERITQLAAEPAVRAAVAVYVLAPHIPMLFMGEEFAAATPFLFFCDFGEALRDAVTQGRRREFGKFKRFADPAARAAIPDPNQVDTFLASRLDWASLKEAAHAAWLAYYRELLQLRRDVIVPRLHGSSGNAGQFEVVAGTGLRVQWRLGDGSTLRLLANFANAPLQVAAPAGALLFATPAGTAADQGRFELGPWAVVWTLDDKKGPP
ncbi:MAG: malto-oligosyltrehalose trehalohydrolase [Hyphomicrobiaceae bacterium]